MSTLVNNKHVSICWFLNIILLETAPKTQNISKLTKEQEMLENGPLDGVQHQFNKNWLYRQNLGDS